MLFYVHVCHVLHKTGVNTHSQWAALLRSVKELFMDVTWVTRGTIVSHGLPWRQCSPPPQATCRSMPLPIPSYATWHCATIAPEGLCIYIMHCRAQHNTANNYEERDKKRESELMRESRGPFWFSKKAQPNTAPNNIRNTNSSEKAVSSGAGRIGPSH